MTENSRGSVRVKPGHKRVRAYLNGELVADTTDAVPGLGAALLPHLLPARGDVRASLIPSGETRHSPSRGDGEVLHVKVATATAERAALRYPGSPAGAAARPDPPGLERDERVVRGGRARLHPPARPVLAGGHPGQLPARAGGGGRGHRGRVTPAADPVRDRAAAALLHPADRRPDGPAAPVGDGHALPVQGHGELLVGGRGQGVHADLVWVYRAPLPESQKVAGLACFYNEKVDVYLDGERQGRPALTSADRASPGRCSRRCPRFWNARRAPARPGSSRAAASASRRLRSSVAAGQFAAVGLAPAPAEQFGDQRGVHDWCPRAPRAASRRRRSRRRCRRGRPRPPPGRDRRGRPPRPA